MNGTSHNNLNIDLNNEYSNHIAKTEDSFEKDLMNCEVNLEILKEDHQIVIKETVNFNNVLRKEESGMLLENNKKKRTVKKLKPVSHLDFFEDEIKKSKIILI